MKLSYRQTSVGFTIVELLIVIVVIGILAAIAVNAFSASQKKARDAQRYTDIKAVAKALKSYHANTGTYPSTGGLNVANADSNCQNANPNKSATWVPNLTPNYLKTLPQSINPRQSGYGCYVYASDGEQYLLSAWRAIESGPQTSSDYRRFGFRETNFSDNEGYYCNPIAANNGYWDGFYKYSYTVSNISTCNEIGY